MIAMTWLMSSGRSWNCRPIPRVTTTGQGHDSLTFNAVMARIRIHRRGRPGPDPVLGDKAYSSRAVRSHLR